MNTDDTLCDEIEDATEDDTPYELWIINKKLKIKTVNTKQNTDKVTGTVSTVRTKQTVSQNSKLNLVYILKSSWLGYITRRNRENKAAYGFHDTVAADPKRWFVSEIPQPNQPSTVETV